jgi:Rod binding domain-containing protein
VTLSLPTAGVAVSPQFDRTQLAQMAQAPEAAKARFPKLMAACQSFEAVFLSQLMRIMRQGESEDTLFGGGMAEGIYREFLDDQLASEMATSGSTGVASLLYEQLERHAEAEQRANEMRGHGTETAAGGATETADNAIERRTSP